MHDNIHLEAKGKWLLQVEYYSHFWQCYCSMCSQWRVGFTQQYVTKNGALEDFILL